MIGFSFQLLYRAILILAFGAIAARAEPAAVSITVGDEEETVFRWQRDSCDRKWTPDSPARAFRDHQGNVHLFATHVANRAFVGPTLDQVEHSCNVVYKGEFSSDPADFNDRVWLVSFYTIDGKTVYSLTHNEYQGHHREERCPSGSYLRCWYNTIALAISTDGGYSFSRAGHPHDFVAGVPYPYEPDMDHNRGLFLPSNIISRNGYYYFLAFSQGHGAQKTGSCLIRTHDLSRADSWRGWDGDDFSVEFVDPYRVRQLDPKQHVCEPVGQGRPRWPVHSLVWSRARQVYIALSPGQAPDPQTGEMARGVVAFSSEDLLTWSEPTLVMRAVRPADFQCGMAGPLIAYPSLLDPDSTSRNFETVGEDAWLYFTRWNLDGCKRGIDRDLVRVKVQIANTN